MHPVLMVQCDSAMATLQAKAGWRSVSTMPGALSVMMDGMMQMLQWSAETWAITQLVGAHNSVCAEIVSSSVCIFLSHPCMVSKSLQLCTYKLTFNQ